VSEVQKNENKVIIKKMGVTDFVSERNYPDFEKLAHVIQHDLQGFKVKNIEGESTEANDISRILVIFC